MARPILLAVSGAPGTGKTTLASKFSKDLSLPCLDDDNIKELLFDKLGVGDVAWLEDLDAGVTDMLFAFAERWTARGRGLIVESAFYKKSAAPRFEAILRRSNIIFLEVHCTTKPEVRAQRIAARNQSGTRHPGHMDLAYPGPHEPEATFLVKYAPLDVGEIFKVDTTSFAAPDYQALLANLQDFIQQRQEES